MNKQIKALLDSPNEANQRLGILLGRQNGIYYKDIAKYVLNSGAFSSHFYGMGWMVEREFMGFHFCGDMHIKEQTVSFSFSESAKRFRDINLIKDSVSKKEKYMDEVVNYLAYRIGESFRKPITA